ncbi:MAG: phytanoyl-CoA dioxygenase family protein [Leptolyngbyaceae cyanobacterium MAG.088]|nr:phytanoyl-CoA dioxygenase family protein [Leptolyngbyaceae cyanobacterium MAG.088]
MSSLATDYRVELTQEEVQYFDDNGFVGPFPLFSDAEDWRKLRQRVENEAIGTVSDVYGFETGRDRYLDCPSVYEMISQSSISNRLQQLLGPDLLVWRSAFFYKPAGAPETVWHRANLFKEYVEHAILEPPDINDLFQLTVWIAIDDATLDNGCVQFISGGTNKEYFVQKTSAPDAAPNIKEDGKSSFGYDKKGFFGYDLKVDFELDPNRVVNMECASGEFFIFDQRAIHGSLPNKTDSRRVGMNFRTIKTDVRAYRHFLDDNKIEHYGRTFNLERWGCLLLSGEDDGNNRIVTPPSYS